jgi:hypothetical protein
MRTHFFVLAVLMSPMTLVAQTASTKPLPGKWTIERDKSEMDDSRIVTLSLSAERAITVWLKEVVPKLILRCKEGKMDAYIFTRTAAQPELGQYEQASVRWRIDDSTATPEMWNESTDKSALFSPAPVEFVRRLTEAKTFRFEFTPFNSPPVIVRFDVRGLKTYHRELVKACGDAMDVNEAIAARVKEIEDSIARAKRKPPA